MGIHFENDLPWNKHLSVVHTRIRSVSCSYYNIKVVILIFVRGLIVQSLAVSVLRSGVTIFANCIDL